MTPKNIERWLMQSNRPSLLLLVVTNSIIWALVFFFSSDVATRNTMRLFIGIASPTFWTFIWTFAAVYQVASQFQKKNWCKQLAAAIVAMLNWFSLALIILALWPSIPALISGHICVTLAATLLYITGDRRKHVDGDVTQTAGIERRGRR